MRLLGTIAGFTLTALLATTARADPIQIAYVVSDTGTGYFQYTYYLTGTLDPFVGIDLKFPLAAGFQSGDLVDSGDASGNLTQLLLQPDPGIPDDGHLTAYNGSADFSQSFDKTPELFATFIWRGPGLPGPQEFDIFQTDANLDSFNTIATGTTTPLNPLPLPAAGWLLASALLGGWGWLRRGSGIAG